MRELKPTREIQPARPWPALLPHEALRSHFYRVAGRNFGDAIGEFREGENHWAVDHGQMWEMADRLTERTLEDSDWIEQMLEEAYRMQERLLTFTNDAIYRTDLSGYSDGEMLEQYRLFRQYFFEYFVRAYIPDAVEGPRRSFSRVLKDFLMKQLVAIEKGHKIGEYFTVLTTPLEPSLEVQEERLFLQVAQKIRENKKATSVFKKKSVALDTLSDALRTADKSVYRKVLEHVRNYEWLPYEYEGPVWSREDFLKRWRQHIRRGRKTDVALGRIDKREQTLRDKQERYERDIGLSRHSDMRYLFRITRRLMVLRDTRHGVMGQAFMHMDKWIEDIARRTGVTSREVRLLLPFEMRSFVMDEETRRRLVKEFDARERYAIVVVTKGRIRMLTGKPAEDFGSRVFRERVLDEDIEELKGDTGFPGTVRGMVRVVASIHDISKVQDGDIMITPRANPNMLPAIRKASAVVADAGGITSHAAILCRDVETPCIVGTDIAAQVLGDGDEVEVNADEGIVTIVKKK